MRQGKPEQDALSTLANWARFATLCLTVLFPLLFLVIALKRLRFPFELDRMESGMVTSVWRLRQGMPLYGAPSMEWAPFLYAPLFFYVSAAITKVVGVGYTALRLVSLVATLGSFALIFALVWTEAGRRWRPALFAVGVFASLYPFVQAWYDVGRVDSLALFFFLAALWATRCSHPLIAAVLWWLAFLTKQTFLPLGLALFLVEWPRPRRMVTGMAAYLVLVAGSYAWLQHVSHGWFRYYAFGTAGVIKWSPRTAILFPFADLLAPLPIACSLMLTAALTTGIRWRKRDGSYFAIVTVLLAVAIGYVRGHVGANVNAVIPLYAWMAVLSGIALDRLLVQASPLIAPGLVWLLAAVQLAAHLYRPAEIHMNNVAARVAFLDALRRTEGDVWVADHSYDAILAGKPLHADMDALDAVLGRRDPATTQEFQQMITGGQLTAVVLDRVPEAYEPPGVFTSPPFSSVYRLKAIAPGGGATGEVDQPLLVLLPCGAKAQHGSLTDFRASFSDTSGCTVERQAK